MIAGQEDKPPLDELAHFGVKGMKWGRRKAEPPTTRAEKQARVKQLNRKMDRLDMNRALTGIGIQGWSASKLHAKAAKKDPNYDATGKTWSKEQKAEFKTRVDRHAKRTILRGALKTSAIVYGVGSAGIYSLQRQGLTDSAAADGRRSLGALAVVPTAVQAYGQWRAVTTARKRQDILDERIPLEDDLAHFGVKGMRWGVRQAKPTTPAKKLTPQQKKEEEAARKAKRAAQIGMGITIAAGIGKMFLSAYMQSHEAQKRVDLQKKVDSKATFAKAGTTRRLIEDKRREARYALIDTTGRRAEQDPVFREQQFAKYDRLKKEIAGLEASMRRTS